ncbi:chromogranin-A [Pungitius pungitius]|uniref:chromogranin-A n=1 Tax=Pungitius pungitius TaxID=134920 RepID=UPI002E15E9B5
MIARGLFVLSVLTSCVVSLPVTPSQLENENEDVEVMKCIVEALADVLSRPHPVPVSEECLVTMKTDDRLVSVLRRHNFLKLLQDIAVRGHQERAAATPEPTTRTPQAAEDDADQSMLEALGGPGERSILSQKEREGEKDDSVGGGESRDATATGEEEEEEEEEEEVKEEEQHEEEEEERDESPGSRGSASVEEGSEGKADKRGEEEEEEEDHEEKRAHLHEEHMMKDKKGARSGEERDAPRIKSQKKFVEEGEEEEEEEEEEDKRSAYFSHGPKPEGEQEEEEEVAGEMKRDSHTRWTKRGKSSPGGKQKAVGEEAPHHSKEEQEEEEKEGEKKGHAQRSPEEKELRMIAGGPEERRGAEEEGSAGRKPEEPGIESLAAIESELESVAQKLHEMRRG